MLFIQQTGCENYEMVLKERLHSMRLEKSLALLTIRGSLVTFKQTICAVVILKGMCGKEMNKMKSIIDFCQ